MKMGPLQRFSCYAVAGSARSHTVTQIVPYTDHGLSPFHLCPSSWLFSISCWEIANAKTHLHLHCTFFLIVWHEWQNCISFMNRTYVQQVVHHCHSMLIKCVVAIPGPSTLWYLFFVFGLLGTKHSCQAGFEEDFPIASVLHYLESQKQLISNLNITVRKKNASSPQHLHLSKLPWVIIFREG